MAAYYNEFDPFAAAWLRELIKGGHIAPGEVDERSVEDVHPHDLNGFEQVHLFAGIGVWSYALRQIGWPDDAPIWSGSFPCQPFSAAGKGDGFDDERHLWPHGFHLISQCAPAIVVGEQVASKDGLAWLDLIQADLEGAEYAVGAVDTCAAGFGAPHIRQRLYWIAKGLADTDGEGLEGRGGLKQKHDTTRWEDPQRYCAEGGGVGRLADVRSVGREPIPDAERARVQRTALQQTQQRQQSGDLYPALGGECDAAGATNGFWRDADWLYCRDERWRPVEPGTFPLAHGTAARVGRLRGYGNAINAEQAKAFLEAALT